MSKQVIILSKEDLDVLVNHKPICFDSSVINDDSLEYVLISEEGFSNYMKNEEAY